MASYPGYTERKVAREIWAEIASEKSRLRSDNARLRALLKEAREGIFSAGLYVRALEGHAYGHPNLLTRLEVLHAKIAEALG
jgi:hypothetical protein